MMIQIQFLIQINSRARACFFSSESINDIYSVDSDLLSKSEFNEQPQKF